MFSFRKGGDPSQRLIRFVVDHTNGQRLCRAMVCCPAAPLFESCRCMVCTSILKPVADVAKAHERPPGVKNTHYYCCPGAAASLRPCMRASRHDGQHMQDIE